MPSVCGICWEKFTAQSVALSTRCGHVFHEDCIEKWLESSSTCPECRGNSGKLQRIYLNFRNEEKKKKNLQTKLYADEPRRDAASENRLTRSKKELDCFKEVIERREARTCEYVHMRYTHISMRQTSSSFLHSEGSPLDELIRDFQDFFFN